MNARTWFRFQNKADDPTVAEIHIIDFIGDWIDDAINRFWNESIGVTARAFVEQLAALPATVATIHVHINSPGGDVQGGINIANALREQASKGRTVETFVDGIAASIASVIAMAGSKVHIGDNALFMVHNPWTIVLGDAAEMRKTAEVLDTIRGQIVNTYKWHSSLSTEELAALMDAETWMDADQAIEKGFATDKVEGLKAAAAIPRKAAARLNVPEPFKARVEAFLEQPTPEPTKPQPAAALEVVKACNAAGCADLAEGLIAAGATREQVQAKVAETSRAKADASARDAEIRGLCAKAGLAPIADSLVRSQMSIADVKAHITNVKALHAGGEIDGSLPVDPRHADVDASWKTAHQRAKGSRLGGGTRH